MRNREGRREGKRKKEERGERCEGKKGKRERTEGGGERRRE